MGDRRDFLKGKWGNAPEGAVARADGGENADERIDLPDADMLLRVGRPAMAGQFEVCLSAGQYERGAEAALEALDLVETLEDRLSYFRETSDIWLINHSAAWTAVKVEPSLFDLLRMSLQLGEETGRAFDLTAAPLWELWGFARRAGAVPDDARLSEAMEQVGGRFVEIDADRRTIRFLREGVKINLGGVGKGYALDRAADIFCRFGIRDYLFHGGYSSVLARGSSGGSSAGGQASAAPGWTVGVRHPLDRGKRVAEVRLRDRALSTSGLSSQSFRHKGRRYGHIIDPRTGRPAEGVLSATVLAPGAALAEILSTAFYVLGPQPTVEYCQSHPDIGAVLIVPSKQSGRVEIISAGMDERELTVLQP
jgi:FAD:protein FMN transferase